LRLRGEVSAPIEVLRSATSVNADLLQCSGHLGCIREGALADLIVLNFDPLRSLEPFADAERNIVLVMKGGEIVRNDFQ
jgi:imidazolonepropionase-like amidohydrolase